MNKHFQIWLIRPLAVAVLCGVATVTKAQYNTPVVPAESSYGPAIDPTASQPLVQASTNEDYTAFSPAANDSDLAKRLADVEGALKKINDKTAADKKAAEGKPSVNVGGLIQFDTAAFGDKNAANETLHDPSGNNAFINGTEPRRLRLQAAGEAFFNMDYKLEVDFASTSRPKFKDVYFNIKELPYVQNVRIGHFKEPLD